MSNEIKDIGKFIDNKCTNDSLTILNFFQTSLLVSWHSLYNVVHMKSKGHWKSYFYEVHKLQLNKFQCVEVTYHDGMAQ